MPLMSAARMVTATVGDGLILFNLVANCMDFLRLIGDMIIIAILAIEIQQYSCLNGTILLNK